MNAYDKGRDVERIAIEEVLPWLVGVCDGKVYGTDTSEFLQKVWGDFIARRQDKGKDREYSIELKAEEEHTGNLILELWSNKKWFTPGWMYTSHARYLFYFFTDNKILYVIDFISLKQWFFGADGKRGAMYRFPEVTQKKRSQANDTWGALVDVEVLKSKLGSGIKMLTEADRKLHMANSKGLLIVPTVAAANGVPK